MTNIIESINEVPSIDVSDSSKIKEISQKNKKSIY